MNVITWRRGRCTPNTFMVSALARIFRASDVFVTPSISLLISAKTWLRKMFLMYMVRNSRRGHCLAGPSPRACSISWINLEDKQNTTTVKRIRKIVTEIWPNMAISACCHGEIWGNYQNSKPGQASLISTYIWVCCVNTSYFTYSIETGWNRNKNFKLVGRKERQKYLLIQEGNVHMAQFHDFSRSTQGMGKLCLSYKAITGNLRWPLWTAWPLESLKNEIYSMSYICSMFTRNFITENFVESEVLPPSSAEYNFLEVVGLTIW